MQPSGIIAIGGMWSALDPAPGRILWQTAEPTGSWAFGPVSVANGVVYAGSMDPLDAATAKILWSFAWGGSVANGPPIADGMVSWGSGYEHLNSPLCTNRSATTCSTRSSRGASAHLAVKRSEVRRS